MSLEYGSWCAVHSILSGIFPVLHCFCGVLNSLLLLTFLLYFTFFSPVCLNYIVVCVLHASLYCGALSVSHSLCCVCMSVSISVRVRACIPRA